MPTDRPSTWSSYSIFPVAATTATHHGWWLQVPVHRVIPIPSNRAFREVLKLTSFFLDRSCLRVLQIVSTVLLNSREGSRNVVTAVQQFLFWPVSFPHVNTTSTECNIFSAKNFGKRSNADTRSLNASSCIYGSTICT